MSYSVMVRPNFVFQAPVSLGLVPQFGALVCLSRLRDVLRPFFLAVGCDRIVLGFVMLFVQP